MSKPFCAALALAWIAACVTPPAPYSVSFTVRPTPAGATVLADVVGGPATAWVGFGVGPGAPNSALDRIENVRAFAPDGEPLEIEPAGLAGYRIETNGRPWKLTYQLDLRPGPTHNAFYRSSTRGDDYLVLVGSDSWPRFYTGPTPLTHTPEMRAAGPVAHAEVRFDLANTARPWRVVTTAWEESPGMFAMREHPIGSVFALGPFTVQNAIGSDSIVVARHDDWSLLPGRMGALVGDLAASQQEILASGPGRRAIAVLAPLPEVLPVNGGLRTAGMVRGQTVLLYARLHSRVPDSHPAISEALAVFVGHEIFHLWVPSAIQVGRELSWLSEGWAMHMGRRSAVATGWLGADAGARRLGQSYRRYLDIGGYRAGSLPAASVGEESQRDLLYLRGELIFQLLQEEWRRSEPGRSFESALWQALSEEYAEATEPLDAAQVRAVLDRLVDPSTVQRYVEGQAPLTPAALGIRGQ